MSRSRKQPIVKDGYKSKWKSKAKRQANRDVRNEEEVTDGGFFKKVSESWNICDWAFDMRNSNHRQNRDKASRK